MADNVRCGYIRKVCRECQARNDEKHGKCQQCGAEMRCAKWSVRGYIFCQIHGGPNPKYNFYGSGGGFVNGNRSNFPITRMAAKYNQMQKDGRVLSNRKAIDVVDTRIIQLLERIDVEEAPDRLKKLNDLWREYSDNIKSGRTAEAASGMNRLDAEFEKIYHDYEAWKQMFDALDLRRRMVESEVKVLTQIKAIITAEDAYEMNAKMLAAVMRVVNDDPKKMKQVQYEFAKLVGDVSDSVAQAIDSDDGRSGDEDRGQERPGGLDQEEFLHPRNEE